MATVRRNAYVVGGGLRDDDRWVGGGYSFVARLGNVTTDHASLWRRSAVPTPDREIPNRWALTTLLPYLHISKYPPPAVTFLVQPKQALTLS